MIKLQIFMRKIYDIYMYEGYAQKIIEKFF